MHFLFSAVFSRRFAPGMYVNTPELHSRYIFNSRIACCSSWHKIEYYIHRLLVTVQVPSVSVHTVPVQSQLRWLWHPAQQSDSYSIRIGISVDRGFSSRFKQVRQFVKGNTFYQLLFEMFENILMDAAVLLMLSIIYRELTFQLAVLGSLVANNFFHQFM